MTPPVRLVFLGSDAIALPLLDWLAGEGAAAAALCGIVTGVDQAAGRGQAVRPNAVRRWSEGRGLAVLQPERLDAPVLGRLRELQPDVFLVVAYGKILREECIALPRLGTLNLHASLLPRLRGASPIQTAVACGERRTGISLMRIVRELDAGPVADVETVAVDPLDTAASVEERLSRAAIPLLARCLPRLAAGALAFAPQEAGAATYCRRLRREDGVLDFAAPAAELAARINGLFPWPAVAVEIRGTPVRLGLADAVPSAAGPPGRVLGADAEGLRVATGAGVLRLRRLQRPGGRMLAAGEFLRGFPVAPGLELASRPMPPLVSERPFPR